MKQLYRNILILIALICFLSAASIADYADAQTRKTAQPTPPKKAKTTPTPVKKAAKKSPTPTKTTITTAPKKTPTPIKATTKPTPKKTPTPIKSPTPKKSPTRTPPSPPVKKEVKKNYPQLIVNVASGRVRREPDLSAETVKTVALGTVFNVTDKNSQWSQIALGGDTTGWISNTITNDYQVSRREQIYTAITDKYLKRDNLAFRDATQVYDFLSRVAREIDSAEIGYKRLQILDAALRLIPPEKAEENPYKNFTDANADKIVYSEPAGRVVCAFESVLATARRK